jgi:hypothetical protein
MKILVRRVNQSLFAVGNDARQALKALPSGDIQIEYGASNKRTGKQNSCLYEFFENIANACNDSGQEMEVSSPVLSKPVTVRWTKESVKEYIWRPVQVAMFPDTQSTTDLTTVELMRVTEQLQHFLVTRFTINVEFPSVDSKRHLDAGH